MSKNKASSANEAPDFEAAIKELETLVEKLESGDLGLAESLSHFESGVRLSRQCHSLIDRARQTVEMLSDIEDEASATALPVSDQAAAGQQDDEIPF